MSYRIGHDPLAVTIGGRTVSVRIAASRIEAHGAGGTWAYLHIRDLCDMDVDVVWTSPGVRHIADQRDRDILDDALRAIGRQVVAVDSIRPNNTTYHIGRIGFNLVAWDGHIAVARQSRGREITWLPEPADVPTADRPALADRLDDLVST